MSETKRFQQPLFRIYFSIHHTFLGELSHQHHTFLGELSHQHHTFLGELSHKHHTFLGKLANKTTHRIGLKPDINTITAYWNFNYMYAVIVFPVCGNDVTSMR